MHVDADTTRSGDSRNRDSDVTRMAVARSGDVVAVRPHRLRRCFDADDGYFGCYCCEKEMVMLVDDDRGTGRDRCRRRCSVVAVVVATDHDSGLVVIVHDHGQSCEYFD